MEATPINAEEVESQKKKMQNLFALCILLGGLFVGSLFVDFVQLFTGQGFSQGVIKKFNVLEAGGKTWVGYDDPKVSVQVITDNACATCDPNEALVWLRRVLPTVEATRLNYDESSAQALIERFHITTLPAFVFSDTVTQSNFYSQASSLFHEASGSYFFDMTKIGLPVGKYLRLPEVREGDIARGNADAKVTVVEFSDFECSYCKTYHQNLALTLKNYGDQVRYVYKSLPLSFHAQAENAALAGYCANEQGKFDTYADYLFTKQDEWSKTTGTQKFKDYAWWLRLNGRQFSSCMDTNKYADKIAADKAEAESLAVHGTPGTFMNGTFVNGAISVSDIKKTLETELAK